MKKWKFLAAKRRKKFYRLILQDESTTLGFVPPEKYRDAIVVELRQRQTEKQTFLHTNSHAADVGPREKNYRAMEKTRICETRVMISWISKVRVKCLSPQHHVRPALTPHHLGMSVLCSI